MIIPPHPKKKKIWNKMKKKRKQNVEIWIQMYLSYKFCKHVNIINKQNSNTN